MARALHLTLFVILLLCGSARADLSDLCVRGYESTIDSPTRISPKLAATKAEIDLDRARAERKTDLKALEERAIDERFELAKSVVDSELDPKWKTPIWQAHRTTSGQKGKITVAQLTEKVRILKAAGVPKAIRRKLLKEGVCGPTDEAAFYDDIRAAPDNEDNYLIFTDFLDESGEHDRAELIRIQRALKSLKADDRRRPELERRQTQLFGRLPLSNSAPKVSRHSSNRELQAFADWLELNGDLGRAEFIRQQIGLAESGYLPSGIANWTHHINLQFGVTGTLLSNLPGWTSSFQNPGKNTFIGFNYRRGLVDTVRIEALVPEKLPDGKVRYSDKDKQAIQQLVDNIPEVTSVTICPSMVRDHTDPTNTLILDLSAQPISSRTFEISKTGALQIGRPPVAIPFISSTLPHIALTSAKGGVSVEVRAGRSKLAMRKSEDLQPTSSILVFGLYSADGRLIRRYSALGNEFTLDKQTIGTLPPGKYSLKIIGW